ncbi:hypothetical protein HYPSUDRAFT_58963 [Hypholoma sublateritium FD-334 SS-4]|uniref:Uncharacterized protein n=1 Tax=Hypholoma sublateritium (strain FD-334 SS-4) TaxID=945553 RepID=A0A0D2LWF5_HYPSF|nr:hypothetical protein HYPSUDRAFT_58963 [Hypholoma sublateritium FD-334 SS-4]
MAGIEIEGQFCDLDLGPIDTLDPNELKKQYDEYFGTSPLSSLSSSPLSSLSATLSRSPSIGSTEYERLLDDFYGLSPLSSPPSSPSTSTASLTHADPNSNVANTSATHSPATQSNSKPANAKLNSKGRRNRKKGKENRCRKRQEVREQNPSNPPSNMKKNIKKHVATAKTTQTHYDTKNIPSASSGFVALPDGGPGKYSRLRPLLRGGAGKRGQSSISTAELS